MIRNDKKSDLWETPQWLFDELNDEFSFTIDVCANENNTKCTTFLKDALDESKWISNTSCFMNPPYSNPKPFIDMAYKMSKELDIKIVCLLKCDTSTKSFGVFWDYEKQEPKEGVHIRFLPKRLKFEIKGKAEQSAPFPSVIVIMDKGNRNEQIY